MLLWNLDVNRGLYNGTRLIIHNVYDHIIDAEVLAGSCKGKKVLIPKIKLAPSDSGLPFILQRTQFPVRLSYSMTINTSQGQTFNKLGLFLDYSGFFPHGQLYVALSRTRSFDSVHIQIRQTTLQGNFQATVLTTNVVFEEVL